MKLSSAALLASALHSGVSAFQVSRTPRPLVQPSGLALKRATPSCLYATDEDCGCDGPEILSGDAPEGARTANPREAMRTANVYRTSGEAVSMDELLDTDDELSVVVFLRSLG